MSPDYRRSLDVQHQIPHPFRRLRLCGGALPTPRKANLAEFPLSLDRDCGRPIVAGHRGGQRPKYCDNPEHTALRAFRARQKLDAKAAKQAAAQPVPAARPVTDGVAALAGLVRRLEELKAEITAVFEDAGELATAITDPAAVAHEVEQVRREADIRVAEAESARADAEHAAAAAAAERDRARALGEAATAAAEEAIAERDAALARTTAIVDNAKQQIAEAEADQDRVYTEAEQALRQMREQLEQMRTAAVLSEDQRAAAVRLSEAHDAAAQQIGADLDEQRTEHLRRIEHLHTTYREDLAAARTAADGAAREVRQQHTAELAAARADFDRIRGELRAEIDAARAEIARLRQPK